nr:cupredoxin domain-containing protein [Geodermatophilaceae bacterium]
GMTGGSLCRFVALTAAVAVLTGCGGADPRPPAAASSGPTATSSAAPTEVTLSPGPDGVQAVTLVTQDNYRFRPSRFLVVPGPVRVTLQNPSTTVHNLRFADGGPAEQIPVVRAAQEATVEFTVSTPGEYEFICTFHVQFNERGTMVVR